MKNLLLLAMVLGLLVSGCATTHKTKTYLTHPINIKGDSKWVKDCEQCRDYAEEISAGRGKAVRVLGNLVVIPFLGDGVGIARGIVTESATKMYEQVFDQCMKEKDYSIEVRN